jgi:hypothetical protein
MSIWERGLSVMAALCLMCVVLFIALQTWLFVPSAIISGRDPTYLLIPLSGLSAASIALCIITAFRQFYGPRPGYMMTTIGVVLTFNLVLVIMLQLMISHLSRSGEVDLVFLQGLRVDVNNTFWIALVNLVGLLIIPLLRNFAIRPRLSPARPR